MKLAIVDHALVWRVHQSPARYVDLLLGAASRGRP
jgi:hypothetical protein